VATHTALVAHLESKIGLGKAMKASDYSETKIQAIDEIFFEDQKTSLAYQAFQTWIHEIPS
jgi:hypothetical protein